MLQRMLRRQAGCGYGAQEFIIAGPNRSRFGSRAARFEMTVPVKKADTIWVRLFSLPTRVRGARQRFSRAMLHLDMQLGRQTFLP